MKKLLQKLNMPSVKNFIDRLRKGHREFWNRFRFRSERRPGSLENTEETLSNGGTTASSLNENPESSTENPTQAAENIHETREPSPAEPRPVEEEENFDEEIIFPFKAPKPKPVRKRTSPPLRFMIWIALLAMFFFLGYRTQPENLDQTILLLEKYRSMAFDKAKPLTKKLESVIREKIGKKSKATSAAGASGTGKSSGRKIKYWKAPMTPGYITDKPGKSPMGMDMIPVYEDEADLKGVRIDPTMVQNIGVRTQIIREQALNREIRTIGLLTYDERLVNHIHTKYDGWIEKLYVDFTGQEVKKGDLLVEIYSPELVSTQEELLMAIKYREILKNSSFSDIGQGAFSLVESTRRRLVLFDVPEHQIAELIRTKRIKKTLHVHSPDRGFVIKKKAFQGMRVLPGMKLYTIADLGNIWVLADIYEYEVPLIKMGQEVEMNLSYFPGKIFRGKVTYIDPFLDPKTRTLKVRMEFNNPKWELKPDMYANVVIKSEVAKKALAVPREAVLHSGDRDVVIIRNKTGGFEARDVVLGTQAGEFFLIISGLKKGDEVVTSSTFLIDSESNLEEALNKLQEPPKSSKLAKDMKKMEGSGSKNSSKDMTGMDMSGKMKNKY